jgi:hypothetical protein
MPVALFGWTLEAPASGLFDRTTPKTVSTWNAGGRGCGAA